MTGTAQRLSGDEPYLSVVQLPVNIDLALCDVSSQIRNGMSDVCKAQNNNCVTLRHESLARPENPSEILTHSEDSAVSAFLQLSDKPEHLNPGEKSNNTDILL